jgi:hypothetical protein
MQRSKSQKGFVGETASELGFKEAGKVESGSGVGSKGNHGTESVDRMVFAKTVKEENQNGMKSEHFGFLHWTIRIQ